MAVEERVDRGLERGGHDPLVEGEQVERELLERRGPADEPGRGNDLVAVRGERPEEAGVGRIAGDEPVRGMAVEAPARAAVGREVVDADDLVAGVEQLRDE